MTFLSLLAALLLEQWHVLRRGIALHRAFDRYAAALETRFNGGQPQHGIIAWAVAVVPVVLATLAIAFALRGAGFLAVLAWNVAVLYLVMGFRQFSRAYTEIRVALHAGDLAVARDRLAAWSGRGTAELDVPGIARAAIELGLVASHRCVFGTLFWFVALGPSGAVLYWLSAALSDRWGGRPGADTAVFGRFAAAVFRLLDWAPARFTALTFAVVGNFEDAVYCWREQAGRWDARAHGVILASGAGALGVQLGGPLQQDAALRDRPELGVAVEAGPDHLDAAERLIWRSLVVWMFLIFLVSVARALG